jgi:hypothetical protein
MWADEPTTQGAERDDSLEGSCITNRKSQRGCAKTSLMVHGWSVRKDQTPSFLGVAARDAGSWIRMSANPFIALSSSTPSAERTVAGPLRAGGSCSRLFGELASGGDPLHPQKADQIRGSGRALQADDGGERAELTCSDCMAAAISANCAAVAPCS